jgi:hypothetical protein
MMQDARFGRLAEVAFWLLAIAYILFPLSLTAFPSEDGPVHLYYADVLKQLLTGGNSYNHYFEVRHWLPPYALIYYLFIALEGFVSPLLADRLFVCLYVSLLLFGFRFLLRVLNPRSTAMAVLIFPFVFNKFVYLGFYNFVLAVALTLILCAYWLRDPLRLTGWQRCWFLVLVVLILLTHPVPLLIAFLVMGTHLLTLVFTAGSNLPGQGGQHFWLAVRRCRAAIVSLLLASLASLYILLFASGSGRAGFPTMAESLVKMRKLFLFGPISPFQVWYYALPLGLIVLSLAVRVMVLTFRRRMAWSQSQLILLGMGLFCAMLYVMAPETFSGGAYFDQRFPIFAVLFVLAALGSSVAFEQGAYRAGVVVFAFAIGLASLAYQVKFCRQYQVAGDLYRLPSVKPGSRGAIVMDDAPNFLPTGLAFGPYRWVGAHYFQHSKAVLLNAPFLYTPTMPIKISPSRLTALNSLGTEITPPIMERILVSCGATDEVDFVVYVGNPNDLPDNSRFRLLCARYGFVKAWTADGISIYMRPASFETAEH